MTGEMGILLYAMPSTTTFPKRFLLLRFSD